MALDGIAYHAVAFAPINPAAFVFAAAFCVEAALLAVAAFRGALVFPGCGRIRAPAGWALVAYAMVLYPLLGLAAGEAYPRMPMFGITPCPLTLFTFGVFLLAARSPWWLWIVPVAWSLVGGGAAMVLRVPQDWVLLFSGLVTLPLALRTLRSHRGMAPTS